MSPLSILVGGSLLQAPRAVGLLLILSAVIDLLSTTLASFYGPLSSDVAPLLVRNCLKSLPYAFLARSPPLSVKDIV